MKNNIILLIIGAIIVTISFVLTWFFDLFYFWELAISIGGFVIFVIGATRILKILEDEHD